jgi:LmbE family N-acetylglucosaminyl deacetylase
MRRTFFLVLYFVGAAAVFAQEAPQRVAPADERYKADILVVVAHPDDEASATPYLARAMDLEHRRVAVVFGTRGGSGSNQAGREQAAALADEREIEARRACATLGITNVWFLSGKDTASQNVLQSLANWGHGAALEQMVRLVRLTRPEVILTHFPGVFIGENHGDHQATGVIATEAFDLAGDSAVFPAQLAGPTKRLEPWLENLRPWQPKKIYYFSDASDESRFLGKGPAYSVKELSPTRKLAYWRMALESFRAHETQAKSFLEPLEKMSEAEIEKMATSPESGWSDSLHFVLGKSLVGGSVTGDIVEGIQPGPIAFAPRAASLTRTGAGVSVELGGPWSFYGDFRRAHGLENLPQAEPPEIAVQAGGTLQVPLWLRNATSAAQEVTLTASAPQGWSVGSGAGRYAIPAGHVAALRIEITVPGLAPSGSPPKEASEITVQAEEAGGKMIGTIRLRVALRKRALPQ